MTKLALEHGKHVYSEKPLGVDMNEARELVALAQEKNLLLGGAPDTFMGAGIQTARNLIDSGMIGDVVGANCAMVCHGHETWHPDPEFYYKRGGGPMLDMGPYYITALVQLLGEAKGVIGMTKKSFDQRIITSAPHHGETIDVDVDTYLTGSILFSNGAIAQVFTTFDVYYAPCAQARFEVYGTRGTMVVPDPNTFGGPIEILLPGAKEWQAVPVVYPNVENSRGLGFTDFCRCIRTGEEPLAGWKQTLHVLEVMCAFYTSSEKGENTAIESVYARRNAVALDK